MAYTGYTGKVINPDENTLAIDGANGGKVVPFSGTQASAIADVATAGSATAAANAAAINAILAALRAIGVIASS